MRNLKYTEEEIVDILQEGEAGITASEICRRYCISDTTYHNWKLKYGGMRANDIKKLRQLENENRRLRYHVSDLTADNHMLKAIIAKSF